MILFVLLDWCVALLGGMLFWCSGARSGLVSWRFGVLVCLRRFVLMEYCTRVLLCIVFVVRGLLAD